MRTVDPELWCRSLKRPCMQEARRSRFGQRVHVGIEARLRQSLRDAVTEFWTNCSLAAAKYYNIDKHQTWPHIPYVFLLLFSMAVGWTLLSDNHVTYNDRPPLTVSRQPDDTSVGSHSFPAVALCSNSIISKAALRNYSAYLYTHPKNNQYGYRRSAIEHNLLDWGALQTLVLPPLDVNFDKFIADVEHHLNVTDIMLRLSGNCSEILQRCSWRGKLADCGSLFATRLTALGFCCVFNSRYQPIDEHRAPFMLDLIGQDYGLGVVVKETRDDFAYVRRPAYGMELLLFQGDEFPLLESGDVRMFPVPRNASLFFNIRTFSQFPAEEIAYYPDERRGCRLERGGMSWCLAQCRRDTAAALCGCVPFTLQPQAQHHDAPTCTVNELNCLNKHKEKFMYLFPGEDAGPELSQELQDAMDCSHCRVQCTRHQHSASISYSFYTAKARIFRNFLTENLPLVNSTTIRLFYSVVHQPWYKVEPQARWYELFVKQGTQWVVVTGVSLLTYSELLFHLTIRWVHHFRRRTRLANNARLLAPSR
ncbi:sodium channel protein Nach-like [Helicoverpa zea]|uniref:sodium channel protein Nach-like n=1 Tax=Helicoverpa zea TaxID=7113 RepID=UPI001F5A365C|nr:sodium channel protein Nach-like [Helicoverpa zea]